ncbi:MAG: LPS export ABC transporter periplasmic protein LptC [Alphaproteobacteria bacterium]
MSKFSESYKPQRLSERSVIGYTRFVKILKLLLPAIASVLIGLILIWPQILAEKDKFKINIGIPEFSRIESMRMVNAKFFATDNKNQPYSLSADLAMETEPGSMIIELTKPKADIMMSDNTWVAAEASNGVFKQKDEILELNDGVSIFHDGGYNFEIGKMKIDLKKGEAVSNEKILFAAPFGEVAGEGLSISEKGNKIKITGKTKVKLYRIPKGTL